MSLGKESIQKRVAKSPKETAAKPAAKKSPAKKTATKSAVVTNIAPETVEKVTGHKESAMEKFALGSELPYYLL